MIREKSLFFYYNVKNRKAEMVILLRKKGGQKVCNHNKIVYFRKTLSYKIVKEEL